MKIAILGWGSLIWDKKSERGKEFDRWRESQWKPAKGLKLPLEFSRISTSREGALTLVIDDENGTKCSVHYALSKRTQLEDAIRDLRCREGTTSKYIGYWSVDRNCFEHGYVKNIRDWVKAKNFDAVVWTALESNFKRCKKVEFSVENAIQHLKDLSPEGKTEAEKYFREAPNEIRTRLRTEVKTAQWL